MNSGIINVYKEAGYTSFDVVARLRGILKIKKIGHTGTLDPDAEGVLPVCIGKATKVCDLLTDKDKVYKCVLLLGKITDTYDISGRVIKEQPVNISQEAVENAIMSFVGDIMQIPPMYSALKVNGKKLYELAREGKEIERKPRPVTIFEIKILEMNLPEVTMEIHCSKGTYIRSLCYDIGEKLGCGGTMKSLIRTRVSIFDISDARRLDQIQSIYNDGKIDNILLKVDQLFNSYQTIIVVPSEDSLKRAMNGGKLETRDIFSETVSSFSEGQYFRGYLPDNRFIGIYSYKEGFFVLEKMFLE